MYIYRVFVVVLTCFWSAGAIAQERLALVIGNSAYKNISALANPRNDAELVSSTLETVGFEVIKVYDADLPAFREALTRFGRQLRETNAIGLFYYAGHGVQAGGENFLVPTDSNIADESELSWQAIRLNDVMRVMERESGQMNIVILDACRNNPFPSKSRSTNNGLARVDAPSGTYIAYSTAPGDVALDGEGVNSPYTLALAGAVSTAGLTIEETFKKARQEVLRTTTGRQTPWESSSITGTFHFTKPDQESIAVLQDRLEKQLALVDALKEQQKQNIATKRLATGLKPEDEASGKKCNLLASSPLDRSAGDVVGVSYVKLHREASLAVDACKKASEVFLRDDRYKYQLARALLALGGKDIEAAEWMRQAAENYYPAAMNGYGVLLNHGRGVARDTGESVKWITRAAEKSYVPAMTNLGVAFTLGSQKKSALKAAKWLRKASENSDPYGSMHLGSAYMNGKQGTITDYSQAKLYFDRAIAAGVPEAYHQKFMLVSSNYDMAQDSDEQMKNLEAAMLEVRLPVIYLYNYNASFDLKIIKAFFETPKVHERLESEPIYTRETYGAGEENVTYWLQSYLNNPNTPEKHKGYIRAQLDKTN